MNFKEIFPNYEGYGNESVNMNKINIGLIRDICSIFPKGINERAKNYKGPGMLSTDSLMKKLCNLVSDYTSSARTAHWGWDYIMKDYYEYIMEFNNKKFHRFMDFIAEAFFMIGQNDITDDINEMLEEHAVGYRFMADTDNPWVLADRDSIDRLEESIESLQEISLQAVEHIKQAKTQLNDIDNLRARKDAIRDCLSATETVIKKITGESSYEKASEFLRVHEEDWGPKFIVADCINIWKRFHNEYRDIRHGDEGISEISLEETIYYIDRILAFITYIVKRAEVVGELDA